MKIQNLKDNKERRNSLRRRNKYLHTANTFEELLNISVKSLEGKFPLLSCAGSTFVTDQDCDLESLIDSGSDKLNKDGQIIYKINKNGLLTIGSQSGKTSNIDNTQRAYLTGIIEHEKAIELHKQINSIDGYVATVTRHKDMSNSYVWGIPVTYNNANPYTHIHFDSEHSFLEGLLNEPLKRKIKEEYSTICFIDSKYGRNSHGRNGLFTNVLKTLQDLNN